MTRKENAERHGSTESSGAESWRSQDTVRANSLTSRRRAGIVGMNVKTDKHSRFAPSALFVRVAQRRVRASPSKMSCLTFGAVLAVSVVAPRAACASVSRAFNPSRHQTSSGLACPSPALRAACA